MRMMGKPKGKGKFKDKGKDKKKDFRSKFPRRKLFCQFCKSKISIDYKDTENLRAYITASGKIMSKRVTGVCSKHQKVLGNAIKIARTMALLPFTRRG